MSASDHEDYGGILPNSELESIMSKFPKLDELIEHKTNTNSSLLIHNTQVASIMLHQLCL